MRRVNKNRRSNLFKDPIKHLPDLVKAVQEHKKSVKPTKAVGKKSKYLVKDKQGFYLL